MISPRPLATRWLARATLGLLSVCAACNKEPPVVQMPNEPPPQRAAQSFVHCVEARTSQCVEAAAELGGWDAFYLLTWLGGGSPLAILEALPDELADHTDPRRVQRRFVDEVERYAIYIRGAECEGTSSQPIDPLIDQVSSVAAHRLGRFGLWTENIKEITAGLVEEAHEELGGGSLVRLDCKSDPFRLYVATRKREGRQAVVGLTTLLPRFIDAEPPDRDVVSERLRSRPLGLANSTAPVVEGIVDPWLRFPVEEF